MAVGTNEAAKPAAAAGPRRGRGWHALANPARFLRLMRAIFPWVAGVAAFSIVAGLVLGLGFVPADYQQGDAYRIMFVHVPAASLAMIIYAIMALAGAAALIWRHPLADLIGKASAPVGAVFTFINLFTGALWGEPMWGTWWVWDARLTSMLILFFLYLGYIALHAAFDDPTKGARAAAILVLVGVVNLPIIHFSVDWWNTLHQPATIMKLDRPSIDSSMVAPLVLMFVGFIAYYLLLLSLRIRSEILARRIRNLRLAEAAR
jgi:heme exporter protein C